MILAVRSNKHLTQLSFMTPALESVGVAGPDIVSALLARGFARTGLASCIDIERQYERLPFAGPSINVALT